MLPARVWRNRTFSNCQDRDPIVQSYGDRVTSTSNAAGSYGTFSTGFTPNVVVDYAGQVGTAGTTRWNTDYGDLVNVLENETDGEDRLTVTMSADPGFQVLLYGFDLGGWPNSDYTIPNLFVKDGNGTNLFSQSNVLVRGATGTPRHTVLSFGVPLSAQQLQIYIDLSGLGSSSDNIGIDNIAFAQTDAPMNGEVPEPASWALMMGGGLAVALRARRK